MRCYLYSTINKIRFKNKDTVADEKIFQKELLQPSSFTVTIRKKYNVKSDRFFFFCQFRPIFRRRNNRAEEYIIILILLLYVNVFGENGKCQHHHSKNEEILLYFKNNKSRARAKVSESRKEERTRPGTMGMEMVIKTVIGIVQLYHTNDAAINRPQK